MGRVVHFEIHADDPERAAKFYGKVFDWKIEKWAGPIEYWLVTTGPKEQPGIDGAIMRRTQGGSVWNTVDVPSVDEFARKVVGAGGRVVMPKTAIPGVGYNAYCADSEGNIFGIYQNDPSAK